MARKPKWRIGDRIRIIDPKEFVRCGYKMYLPEVHADITENHTVQIDAAIKAFGMNPAGINGSARSRIEGAFAYARIAAEGFGGRERKIFEIDLPPGDRRNRNL